MQRLRTLEDEDGRDDWDWTALSRSCLLETRKLLSSEHDAQEAAQEALLRAWRRRHSQREPGAVTWWVTRIARNEALRQLARRNRRQAVYTEGSTEDLAAAAVGQDTPIRAEILDLREAISELAPRDAFLLWLRYDQDLTQPRVARLAGMPEGTVKIRLHRIRGRLRERLSESR
jgi:RNA polymerase sigma-70 factor (ECF subfamily)